MNRCFVENSANEHKKKWEKEIFDKISDGSYALVKDQHYLDHYFATKSVTGTRTVL